MPGIIVVGLQWGDEGKGKVIDLLSSKASHISRSQGGFDSTRTIIDENKEWEFRQIPCGILHPHIQSYITSSCIIDPPTLIEEMKKIESNGINIIDRLHLSPHAHLVLPHHKLLDTIVQKSKTPSFGNIHSKGIESCLSDRIFRTGLKLGELIRPDLFKKKLELFVERKNHELSTLHGTDPISFEKVLSQYSIYGELLKPFVSDVEGRLHTASIKDETILLEGAYGTFLDFMVGSYPSVSPTSTLASGICSGAALGPTRIDEVIGVMKPYVTQTGDGPLPTAIERDYQEDFESAENFRETTLSPGRKCRIGWLDLVLTRQAVNLNGIDSISLMKLDVLDAFSEIKVCTGYRIKGQEIDKLPPILEDVSIIEPIYKILPGWQASTKKVTRIRGLPKEARALITLIEDTCNTPVGMVSVGPDRHQTIEIEEDWM